MTTAVAAPAVPAAPSGRMAIRASYASLGFACVGFLFYGLGNILAAPNVSTYPDRLSWVLQCVGPILIAIAVMLHVEHLAYRIGRPAVILIIAGAFLNGLPTAAFVFKPQLYTEVAWSNAAYSLYAVGFVTLGLGLAAVAIHKEKQIESGLKQVADVGDTDPTDVTVHASFFSLIAASTGLFMVAIGYLFLNGHPTGNRATWTLISLGWTFVAVGIISHIDHLSRHIGRAAVAVGVFGAALIAVSTLPYAVDPGNWTSTTWAQSFWDVWGSGPICGAIAVGLVILRKRSIEAESAVA